MNIDDDNDNDKRIIGRVIRKVGGKGRVIKAKDGLIATGPRDDLFEMEDLDGNNTANSINATAEELKATPMSEPPRKPVVKVDPITWKPVKTKKAKYKKSELPSEVVDHVRVCDRYGNEIPDVLEFDPETFTGKRISQVNGKVEDFFSHNGYVIAAGFAYPDDIEYSEIVKDVRQEVILRGRVTGRYNPVTREDNRKAMAVDKPRQGPAIDRTPEDLRCNKCQSKLRMDDDIQKDGTVSKRIVCTNGLCGNTWHNTNAS